MRPASRVGTVLLLAVLLGACLPAPRPAPWPVPVTLGERTLRLPVPFGLTERCAGEPRRLAREAADEAASVRLLACFEPSAAGPWDGVRGRVTALRAAPVDAAQFQAYKAAIRSQVAGLHAALERGEPLPGGGRVLRILHEDRDWVVHAVLRERAAAGAETGVLASVLIEGRLLYLSLMREADDTVPWELLGDTGRAWAERLITMNLFSVAS